MTFSPHTLTRWFLSVFPLIVAANPNPDWVKPHAPFRIAGNLYYVGSRDLASYLITTPQGNILINSNLAVNVPQIKASIKKLGFKYTDTKLLLTNQVHSDHAAGSAIIKAQTHAKYWVMQGDAEVAESGGKKDFLLGEDSTQHYQPTKVDHVLHDGEVVELGGVKLTAHLTPGHTKGCTTWTLQVIEQGKPLQVVIVGGTTINPGTTLLHNPRYPNIVEDYQHTWKVSKALPCDIFLGAHGVYFNLLDKYAHRNTNTINPFIDPKGYQTFIHEKEKDFQAALDKESA